MNREKRDTFLEQLKRPIVIMIAVILLGIVLNVIIVAYQVLPKLQQAHTMANKISQLEVQKNNLEKLPAVVKITEDAINRLEKQVPVNPEEARLLISLKEIEKKSGALMASLAFGDDKPAKDALSNLLSGIPLQQATTNGGTATSNSDSATANAQASPAPAAKSNPNPTTGSNSNQSLVTDNKISMQLDGSYLQLITFITLLQQNDRLLAIKKWNLQTTGNKESNNEFNLRLSLIVAAYTAPALAGKLKELPPVPVATPDKRIDPTASDKDYLDLLELLRQQQLGATNK